MPSIALGFFEQALNGRRTLTHSGGGHGWGHLLVLLLPEEHTGVTGDGRIQAVGPASELAASERDSVVQAPGASLLPGLINMHAHLSLA